MSRNNQSSQDFGLTTQSVVQGRFQSSRQPLSWVGKLAQKMQMAFSANGGTYAPGYGSSSTLRFYGALPGSRWNYELECGDTWLNSVVMPSIAWIQRNFTEAELQVYAPGTGKNPKPVIVEDHELINLISSPNKYYDSEALWYATLLSWVVDGNAYWMKVRNMGGMGNPIELWYIPHFAIAPQWDEKGADFITHYLYRVNGFDYKIPCSEIVHFRFGQDPRNTRQGLSPLKACFREIFTDNECSTYTAAIMRNMGVPGAIISPVYQDVDIGPEEQEAFLKLWKNKFTGEGRGEPVLPSVPVKVEKIAFSPEELALKQIRQVPEDRICAAIGLPAMVIGLSSGHEQRTYSNYKEAKESAFENNIIPTQKTFARSITRQLLPDFSKDKQERVNWDWSNVRVLQDDQDKIYKRQTMAYLAGWKKRSEVRAAVGLPVEKGDDIYFDRNARGSGSTAVVPEGQGRPVE